MDDRFFRVLATAGNLAGRSHRRGRKRIGDHHAELIRWRRLRLAFARRLHFWKLNIDAIGGLRRAGGCFRGHGLLFGRLSGKRQGLLFRVLLRQRQLAQGNDDGETRRGRQRGHGPVGKTEDPGRTDGVIRPEGRRRGFRQRLGLERGGQPAGGGADFLHDGLQRRIGGHRRRDLRAFFICQLAQGVGRQARIIGKILWVVHGSVLVSFGVFGSVSTLTFHPVSAAHSCRSVVMAVWIRKPTLPMESDVMRLISR